MREDVRRANEEYAAGFAGAGLPRAPRRRVAVVTCIDTRIDPLAILGLDLGDANVLRNAGGVVTDDVVRSLAVSHHLLGTEEVFVVGHTDCGLHGLDEDDARGRIGSDLPLHAFTDLDEHVRAGVRRIRASPLLPDDVTGLVYDVATGLLREIR